MDSLIAIGAGLGLRALIDSLAPQNMQAAALIGLWEGVVLNHFLGKFPSSLDPYLAFVFRLFVDLFFTGSFTRMLVIVLWTALGMLLADVAVQMSSDRRFRRLGRRVSRMVSSGTYTTSPTSRVRFFEIPGSSSTAGSRTTTALSPDSDSPQAVRPTSTPFPGQFDQWSEVTAPSGYGPHATPSDTASQRSDASRAHEPIRPRTPSELEYITLPTLPEFPQQPVAGPSFRPHIRVDITPRRRSHSNKRNEPRDVDDRPAVKSGLTTPISNPGSLSRPVDDEDRPRVHSGLTTPEHLHKPLQVPVATIPHDTKKTGEQAAVRLTLADPSPTAALPQPQLTPTVIPPVSEIPNIPTPDDVRASRATDNRTPPPPFQEAIKAEVPDDVSSVGESVIVGKRDTIIAKADELRQKARDHEAERDRLREEIRKARKEKRHYDIICLEVELEEAQENIEELHAKAARRYYKAHNLDPAPQEIDVHRLTVEEAYTQVRKAIRDARGFGATQLRVIVGKGNHSKDRTPVLKPAIVSELKKVHIDAVPDPKNSGVLIVNLPSGSFSVAAPPMAPAPSKGWF